MSELMSVAFEMPTAIFSWLMILVIIYWVTVLVGLLDLSILDFFGDLFDGFFDGGAAVIDSLDADALTETPGCLGLAGIPFSIIGSAVVFFAWGFSAAGLSFFPSLAAGTTTVVALGLGAFGLALATTAVALRPARRYFRFPPVTGRKDLVGRTCEVKTLRVDARFGQAEVADNGAPLLIQVRCPEANELTRGSHALIFDYDAENECFLIAEVDSPRAADPESKSD